MLFPDFTKAANKLQASAQTSTTTTLPSSPLNQWQHDECLIYNCLFFNSLNKCNHPINSEFLMLYVTCHYHKLDFLTFLWSQERNSREKGKEFKHVRGHVGKKTMTALEVHFEDRSLFLESNTKRQFSMLMSSITLPKSFNNSFAPRLSDIHNE